MAGFTIAAAKSIEIMRGGVIRMRHSYPKTGTKV